MDAKLLKQQLEELAKKFGPRKVAIALQVEGLSPRSAEMLSMGDHSGEFRRKTLKAVLSVIAKLGAKAS